MRKLFFILIGCLFFLTGCQESGSYVARMRSHSEWDGEISSEHKYLNGEITYRMGNDSEMEINYEITTEKGEINFEILNAESVEEVDEDTLKILNPEENSIKVKIKAKKHTGSYIFETVENE